MATAHRARGYGVVAMTNSDNGLPLLQVVVDRVGRAYGWDMHGARYHDSNEERKP